MNRKEFKKNIPDSTSGLNGSVSSEDLKKLNKKSDNKSANVSTFSKKNNNQSNDSKKDDLDKTREFGNGFMNMSTDSKSGSKTEPVNTGKATDTAKDSETKSHPWDNKFTDDRDQNGNLSRRASKDKQKGNKVLVYTLFAAIIFIMFVPVFNYTMGSNNDNSNTNVTNGDKTEVAKNTKSKHKKKSHKKSTSNKTKSAKKDSNKTSDATTYGDDVDDSADSNSDNSTESTSTPTTTTTANSNSNRTVANSGSTNNATYSNAASNVNSGSAAQTAYYTVKSGDTAFRIAWNHNLTTAQLYSLNGMQRGQTIRTGMHLRVK